MGGRLLLSGTSIAVVLLMFGAGGAAVAAESAAPASALAEVSPPPRDEPLSPRAIAYLDGDIVARGAPCDAGIICGTIKNSGVTSFYAYTNYISSVEVSTTAKKQLVTPGNRAQGAGPSQDWDAYWVPAGYCGTLWGGVYWDAKSTMNRVGQTSGLYDKVDDWGGQVKLAKGYCPS